MTGFETAFNEITLVLFTTLAPSGAAAYFAVGLVVLATEGEACKRIGETLLVPFLVCLVGLVASATHLGNPDNALYVFSRVGASPLSNEVCAAVLFLGVSGVHWLYQFAEHARPNALRALLAAAMAVSLVFLASIAFAYSSRTVITWNVPLVPVALCLNALVGGPVLAFATLRIAEWEPIEGRAGRCLLAVSLLALLANVGAYLAQGAGLADAKNYVVSAAQLVPHYDLMVAAFFVLVATGLLLDVTAMLRGRCPAKPRVVGASALVFAGIFVMRFAFYMMHMTSGMSV